jgi:RNA recognition motif-containing protein
VTDSSSSSSSQAMQHKSCTKSRLKSCFQSLEHCFCAFRNISYPLAVNVYLPKDRVTNNHQGYGFVEYRAEEDADYVSGIAA